MGFNRPFNKTNKQTKQQHPLTLPHATSTMMKISNMTTSDLAKLTSSAKETYPALTAKPTRPPPLIRRHGFNCSHREKKINNQQQDAAAKTPSMSLFLF